MTHWKSCLFTESTGAQMPTCLQFLFLDDDTENILFSQVASLLKCEKKIINSDFHLLPLSHPRFSLDTALLELWETRKEAAAITSCLSLPVANLERQEVKLQCWPFRNVMEPRLGESFVPMWHGAYPLGMSSIQVTSQPRAHAVRHWVNGEQGPGRAQQRTGRGQWALSKPLNQDPLSVPWRFWSENP